MNFIILMVFFVAICAAVLPSSSAVPVDNEVQGEQAISMRDSDVVNEALMEELDKAANCSPCIRKCYNDPNKPTCIRNCQNMKC